MTPLILRRTLAAALLVGTSPLAIAQTADDEAPEKLSTIIVSGVGPSRETDEMIGNATAVSREDIIQTLHASLGDTLDSQPGVTTTFFGAGASRPVLRGLGAERVLVLTNGIGVIDASAASPDHQVAADGIDAEKIEILRGPAALAYGGQAIGGVVNVIDGLIVENLPQARLSGEAYAATNNASNGEEAGARARAAFGPFVLSLSASTRDFDDYDIPGFAESARQRAAEAEEGGEEEEGHEEGKGTIENSFVETDSLSAGLSWVGERGFLGLSVRRQASIYGLPGHEHHEDDDGEEEDEEHEEEHPFIDLEQTRYDLRGGLSVDAGIITDLAASFSAADYAHTEFEAPGEPGTRYKTDGWESRIEAGTEIAGFDGAIGLQVLDKSLAAFGEEAFITPTDTKTAGLFLYQTREWDNGAGIEGGLRFDRTDLDNQVFGGADFTLVSGSFGVHRHWDSGWFLGSQLSWTERAPNESELFADGAHLATNQYEIGDRSLDKERGLNLEATARWEDGNGLSLGANLFHTRFDGFIYLEPGTILEAGLPVGAVDGIPVFLFRQQEAHFWGGEAYVRYTIDDGPLGAGWRGELNVDHVTAELDDGGNVPLLPPMTLNASMDADWGLFSAGASLTIAADQDEPGEGVFPTDGYTTLDLRTALALSRFGIGSNGTELFLEARNVTDEEVRFASSVLKDTVPAPGRNIRAGLRVVF